MKEGEGRSCTCFYESMMMIMMTIDMERSMRRIGTGIGIFKGVFFFFFGGGSASISGSGLIETFQTVHIFNLI